MGVAKEYRIEPCWDGGKATWKVLRWDGDTWSGGGRRWEHHCTIHSSRQLKKAVLHLTSQPLIVKPAEPRETA